MLIRRVRAGGLPAPNLIVTATDVTQGKPHPEPYLKAAARLGYPANECIVIEDVPAGIMAGKAAGMRVIALTTTASYEELEFSKPDWIVKNCGDILVDAAQERFLKLKVGS